MYIKDNELEQAIQNIKELFPKFYGDESIKEAAFWTHFMDTFPEDYVDKDFDYEEISEQLRTMRNGFDSLLYLFMPKE